MLDITQTVIKIVCSSRSVKTASAADGRSSQEELNAAFETTVSAVRAESL